MRYGITKILSLIAAFVIAFTGICLGEADKENVFACESVPLDHSSVSASADTIAGIEPCTTQMLGIRGNMEFGRIMQRSNSQRRIAGVLHEFLCRRSFLLNTVYLHSGHDDMHALSDNMEECVTIYIHKSDGKKKSI